MLNLTLDDYINCAQKLQRWKMPSVDFDSDQIRPVVEIHKERSLVEFTFYIAGIAFSSDQLYHYLDVGIPMDVLLHVADDYEFNYTEGARTGNWGYKNVHLRAKYRGNRDLVDYEVIYTNQESYLGDINLPEHTQFRNLHFQEINGTSWDSDSEEIGESYLEFITTNRLIIVAECRRMVDLLQNKPAYVYRPKRVGKIII